MWGGLTGAECAGRESAAVPRAHALAEGTCKVTFYMAWYKVGCIWCWVGKGLRDPFLKVFVQTAVFTCLVDLDTGCEHIVSFWHGVVNI